MTMFVPRLQVFSLVARVCAAMLIVVLAQTPAVAQQEAHSLAVGQSVEDSLAQKGSKAYSIEIADRYFVYGEVNQITVDVVVKVLDPAGKEIGTFDNPARGGEPFQFTTDTAGAYLIEVTPFEEGSGRFAVEVMTVEPAATTPQGKVDQVMAKYDKPGSPGGVVAVVKSGKVIFSKGYGLADVEYDIPNTPSTPFHMASVSKQFTAFAIVMLAQEGKLTLEDDVRKHLPELPDYGKTITLRNLLNHTSGLRDQWNLWAISGQRMDDVIRQQDLLTLMIHQRELNFEPGAEFLYCNSGYMLLAETVARVSGMSFGAWMKKNVFDPLEMNNTQIYDDHERIVKGRAYSYKNGEEGIAKAVLSYANSGATSLFSTAEDLAKWMENWKLGRLGGEKVLKEMQVRGVLNNGDTLGYALGVGVGTWRGLYRIAHSGGDAGYRTYVAYFPDIDAGVITLGNHGSFDPGGTATEVMEAFFGDLLEPSPPPTQPAASEPEKEEDPWKPTQADLEAFAGRYYSPELETFYTLSMKGSHIVAYHRRLGEVILMPKVKESEFSGSEFALQNLEFVKSPSGRVQEMRVSNGRVRKLLFRKVEE